jgi:hypothetical protein
MSRSACFIAHSKPNAQDCCPMRINADTRYRGSNIHTYMPILHEECFVQIAQPEMRIATSVWKISTYTADGSLFETHIMRPAHPRPLLARSDEGRTDETGSAPARIRVHRAGLGARRSASEGDKQQ